MQREVEALFQLHVNGVAGGPARSHRRLAGLFALCASSGRGESRSSGTSASWKWPTRPAGAASCPSASWKPSKSSRVDELGKKQAASRARAIELSAGGRRADALREMRRLKGIEAQQAAAQKAMDAIDAQQAALEQTTLQRELATALQTSSVELKGRAAGLVEQTEDAIDDAAELQDDVRDAADALQNMKPTYGAFDADEEELVAELDALVGGASQAAQAPQPPRAPLAATGIASSSFPSAPTFCVQAQGASSEKRRLLSPLPA